MISRAAAGKLRKAGPLQKDRLHSRGRHWLMPLSASLRQQLAHLQPAKLGSYSLSQMLTWLLTWFASCPLEQPVGFTAFTFPHPKPRQPIRLRESGQQAFRICSPFCVSKTALHGRPSFVHLYVYLADW